MDRHQPYMQGQGNRYAGKVAREQEKGEAGSSLTDAILYNAACDRIQVWRQVARFRAFSPHGQSI